MNDGISFLVEHDMPLEEIQNLLADGHSLDEIVTNAHWIVDRGEFLSARKQAEPEKQVSVESVKAARRELGVTLRYNQLLKEVEVDGLPACYSTENAANILPVYLADYLRELGFKGVTPNTIPVTNIDKRTLFSLRPEWVNQVWFQTYDMYKANPNFFRLDDDEIKELQADNREFEAPLPYEIEIRALLDYSIPASQWEWWRASEVAKYMPGNADARRAEKALA